MLKTYGILLWEGDTNEIIRAICDPIWFKPGLGFEIVLKNLLSQEIIMTQKNRSILLELFTMAEILR